MEVSIVTPTYNRRQFIPVIIQLYMQQTFPKDKMEWIILDDSHDPVGDLFTGIPNVRYIHVDEKMRIGAKRNRLNNEARAPIIIAMDDDDYYAPHRVQTIVDAFHQYPTTNLLGSSEMFMYYTDTKKIYVIGPFQSTHATNNTMAWRKSYSDTHRHDETVTKGEEESFLDSYTQPMIQLNATRTMLAICHGDNTVDKKKVRNQHRLIRESPLTLEEFGLSKELCAFYRSI